MQETIGELLLESGNPLLKMWNVNIEERVREYVRHSHTRFEITVVNSGTGEYTTENAVYPVAPGDVFVFSSNEQHCITDVLEPLEFVNIHFEPRFFWGSRYESFSDSGMFFHHSKDFCCRLSRENQYRKNVSDLIEEILKEIQEKKEEYKMVARSRLADILVILIREFSYNDVDEKAKKSSSNVKAVKTAMDYVAKHLTTPLTLEEIANKVGMSRSRLSTVFKETLGISLWDYVTEKRIDLCLQMLEHSPEKSMLDIALECGFNNTANFNKAFKKQTGGTPKDFKMHGNAFIYN